MLSQGRASAGPSSGVSTPAPNPADGSVTFPSHCLVIKPGGFGHLSRLPLTPGPSFFLLGILAEISGLLHWLGHGRTIHALLPHSRVGERAPVCLGSHFSLSTAWPVPAVTSAAILSHHLLYPRQPTAPTRGVVRRGVGVAGRVSLMVTAPS